MDCLGRAFSGADAILANVNRKVKFWDFIAKEPISLETPVGEEEDSHLGDFIEDESMVGPADAASRELLKEQMPSCTERR